MKSLLNKWNRILRTNCSCGNSFGTYGRSTADSDCSSLCSG